MPNQRTQAGPALGRGQWPVLAALLVAVLVPTACVLWFMATAVRNERWAVRQRLAQRYLGDLREAKSKLSEAWSRKLAALSREPNEPPQQTFARLVHAGVADSIVVRDREGGVAYPAVAALSPAEPNATPAWAEAAAAERAGDPNRLGEATAAYARIAGQSDSADEKATALRAQARCLVKAGRATDALAVLTGPMSEPALSNARGPAGRLIVPNAMLQALELMVQAGRAAEPRFDRLAGDLARRLNDYAGAAMPSSQRRFLMRALREIAPEAGPFPTLAAEDLAAEYLAGRKASAEPSRLSGAGVPGLWHAAGADGKIVAVFRQESLAAGLAASDLGDGPAAAEIRLAGPEPSDTGQAAPELFLSMPAPEQMPGWKLDLYLAGDNPFATAAARQQTTYLWTGILGIAAIVVLALVVARHVGRQTRLTRLKNDLIATVSHELKTPLASMRAMVETLLAGRCRDRQKELEYFALIARENERLSRLIDNFLTFSRMERNKQAFEFAELRPERLVTEAIDSVADRLKQPGCRLDVEVEPDLPTIVGDGDALVTALLNLLSNAYKYTGPDKHVSVRAYAEDGSVCLAVTDNGVGLTRRAARKVFDRFYQVDQRVSRSVGGCGLGLSIVKFIVDAHGGTVDVASSPGQGSTFTIRLPSGPKPGDGPAEP